MIKAQPTASTKCRQSSLGGNRVPGQRKQATVVVDLRQEALQQRQLQELMGAGTWIQRKLTIGAVDDPLEQEADRVADQVMRMPQPTPTLMQTPSSQQPLMELLPLNAEKTLQRQSLDQDVETEREPLLLAKKETNQASEISPNLETQVQTIRGAGHPLPLSIRAFFEPRFDTDFSGVRLHTDRTADSLNRSLKARAFTSGHDVFFRKEEYDAGSASGKWLLAHELTHVVQQGVDSRGRNLMIHRKPRATPNGNSEATVAVRASFDTENREFEAGKTRQRIIVFSRLIARWVKLYRAESTPQLRQEIQDVILGLEVRLAEALEDNIGQLEAAPSGDAPAVRKEIAENRADLEVVKRLMSVKRTMQFMAQYTEEALRGLNCMGAVYQGLGVLYGQGEALQIKESVEAKAEKHKRETKSPKWPEGVDINQIITIMETVREKGKAGEKTSSAYDRRHGKWNPRLKKLVLGKVNPKLPGFYFFGLSLAKAFHSVILLVDTWTSAQPNIYWCDQLVDECRLVLDLDEWAKERLTEWEQQGNLKYKDWTSDIWPLLPPPEAGIFGREWTEHKESARSTFRGRDDPSSI